MITTTNNRKTTLTTTTGWVAVAMAVVNTLHVMGQDEDDFDQLPDDTNLDIQNSIDNDDDDNVEMNQDNEDEEEEEQEEETWADDSPNGQDEEDNDLALDPELEENEPPQPEILIGKVETNAEPPVDYAPDVLDVAGNEDEEEEGGFDDEYDKQQDEEEQEEQERQEEDEALKQELAAEDEQVFTIDNNSSNDESNQDFDITNNIKEPIATNDDIGNFDSNIQTNSNNNDYQHEQLLSQQQQEESNDLDQELANQGFEEEEEEALAAGAQPVPGAGVDGTAGQEKGWETNDERIQPLGHVVHQNGWEEGEEDETDLSDLSSSPEQQPPPNVLPQQQQQQGDSEERIIQPPQQPLVTIEDDKVADQYDQSIGDSLEKALEQDADVPWYEDSNAKNEDPEDLLREINLSGGGQEQLTQGQQPGISGGNAPASSTIAADQSGRQSSSLIMLIILFMVLFALRKRWLKLLTRQKNSSTLPFYRNPYAKQSLD